jgi:outer membrane protein TolC
MSWQINLADRRAWQSARSQKEYSRLQVENARELVALNVIATYQVRLTQAADADCCAGVAAAHAKQN